MLKKILNKNILKNKVICITGGTGFFGQNLAFQALKLSAKKIIIFSRDEFKQSIMHDKIHINDREKFRFFLGDVRDYRRLNMALENCDYVFHAAAIKRLDTSELNPIEAIKTNILGSQNIIECSINQNVKKIVSLSTDKAASPSSLYGATKLAADKLFVAANNLVGSKKTRFSVVRYGNVANSTGSILPILKQKKIENKFFDLTDKHMTRYWIDINEGVNFVLNCLSLMQGSEIFVPKLWSFKIIDLVKAYGIKKIKIVGKKIGEKMHETMISEHDVDRVIDFRDFYLIHPGLKFIDANKNFKKNIFFNNGKNSTIKNYSSNFNKNFYSVKELKKKLEKFK